MFQFAVKAKAFYINLIRSIDAYKATIKFIDDVNRKHILTQVFYIFSKTF